MKPTHDALLERFRQAFPEAAIQLDDESHQLLYTRSLRLCGENLLSPGQSVCRERTGVRSGAFRGSLGGLYLISRTNVRTGAESVRFP